MSYDPAVGRWLQQDPEGFDAGDANEYRYVSNAPLNGADPEGLYDIDVHFSMTYYLALAVGLGDTPSQYIDPNGKAYSDAFIIAFAAAYTDYNSKTKPYPDASVNSLYKYHFRFSDELARFGAITRENFFKIPVQRNNSSVNNLVDSAISGDPMRLGIALHAYEDSWSHEGYSIGSDETSYKQGHGSAYIPFVGEPNPDATAHDVDKAMEMAEATYNKLLARAKAMGVAGNAIPFEKLKPTLRSLMEQRVPYRKGVGGTPFLGNRLGISDEAEGKANGSWRFETNLQFGQDKDIPFEIDKNKPDEHPLAKNFEKQLENF